MDGVTSDGVLVIPSAKRHDFKVVAKGPMSLYTFTSCHREVAIENMAKEAQGFFTPVPGIEDVGGCAVELGGYDKKNGKHSWGFVDFETSEANLPAVMKCNGEVVNSKGVSVCQSRAGLYQRIEFPVPVVTATASCGKIIPKEEDKVLEFALPKGQCVFAIREKGGGRMHRLTTIGYESILIRGE